MRRFVVTIAVGLLVGCQQTPVPELAQAPSGSPTIHPRAAGDQLAARGDYAAAAIKYQTALDREPSDVSHLFALGVALSHLDRRGETIAAFRRVVDRGQPDSREVEVARGWLVRAGVLSEPVSFTSSKSGSAADSSGPTGTLRGKTQWKGVGAESQLFVRLALAGDGPGTQGRKFLIRRLRLGKPYVFEDVPPGAYRLVVHGGGSELWDQRTIVEPYGERVLDLSPANSPVPPDEYPISSRMRERQRQIAKYSKPGEAHVPGRDEPPPAGER